MNVTEATLSTSSSASSGPNSGMKNQRQMVNVSYTIWIGTNESHHIIVNAPKNGTFYNVMVLAAEMSHYFQFTASEWPNGHYVHTLAGLKEEPMSYHYWLLYRLFSPPDKLLPPGNQLVAPGGIIITRIIYSLLIIFNCLCLNYIILQVLMISKLMMVNITFFGIKNYKM